MECGRLIKSTGTKQELRPIRRPIRVFPLWREIGVDRYILSSLRANGFKTFIVSGDGIEFMRPWTEKVDGIPPERVVGSSIKTKFELRDGKPVLVRLPELNSIDDKEGKPVDTRNLEVMCRMDVPRASVRSASCAVQDGNANRVVDADYSAKSTGPYCCWSTPSEISVRFETHVSKIRDVRILSNPLNSRSPCPCIPRGTAK